jgi:hypothetical protein
MRPEAWGVGREARGTLAALGLAALFAGGLRSASADTLYLKDGRRVEAEIRERSDEKVVVDWFGVPVSYWASDIERIQEDDQPVPVPRIIRPEVPPAPAVLTPEHHALIDELLTLSGAQEKMAQLREQMRSGLEAKVAQATRLSPEERQTLAQTVQAALGRDALYAAFSSAFIQDVKPQHLVAVHAWLSSPAGRTITRAEIEPTDRPALQAFAGALEVEPPPEGRLELVRRLHEGLNMTELFTSGLGAMFFEMGRLLATGDPPTPGDMEAAVAKALQAAGATEELNVELILQTLFVYRAVPDEVLEQYAQFAESEAGRWFERHAVEAMFRALGGQMGQAMQAWGPMVKSRKAP